MPMKKKVATRDEEQKIAAYQEAADLGAQVPAGDETPQEAPSCENAESGAPAAGENGAAPGGEPSLAEQLEAKSREAQETYDRMLRISAEFDNYRKRSARELEDFRKYANEGLLRDLLPVVDNLERALEVPAEGEANGALRQGIELTLKEIVKFLDRFAVRPVEARGKPFDPAFHEAMMQEETDTVAENTVVREFQKGYTIHDRLLRPAMVIVAKAAAKGQDKPPAGDTTEAQSK